jgi:hypothetical protein
MSSKPDGVTQAQWQRFLKETEGTSAEWVLVTPEQAEVWMGLNTKNRKLSGPVSSYYAAQMSSGDWIPTGQAIIFGRDGKLLDGQHRLSAIIQSGQPVALLVVRGITPEAFKAIDRGKGRSIGDLLHLTGEANAPMLGCACRYLATFRATGRFGKAWGRVSYSAVAEVLLQNPDLRVSAGFAQNYSHSHGFSIGSPSLLCVLHYLFSQANKEEAAFFFDRLGTGQELYRENPILQLRNLLIKNRAANLKYTTDQVGRYCVKAWNTFATGEVRHSLRVDDKEDLGYIVTPTVPLQKRFKNAA